MTQSGQEPAPGEPAAPEPRPGGQPPEPWKPILAESNPKSGRQLAMIVGAMGIFFFALVILATWAADKG